MKSVGTAQIIQILFTHTNDLLALEDPDGRLLSTSAAWESQLGWTERELFGMPAAELLRLDDLMPPETSSISRGGGLARHKNGQWRSVEWNRITIPEAELRVHIGKLVEGPPRALPPEEAARALQGNEPEGGEVNEILAHELRTALHGVLGGLALLGKEPCSVGAREHIELSYRSAKHMQAVIEQTLEQSASGSGELSLVEGSLELVPLLRDVLEICRASTFPADPPPIILEMDPVIEPLSFVGDATRIRQILINLLRNSVKFCPKGEILVSVKKTDAGVAFRVSDQGPGMTEEELAQLFRPRFQGRAGQLSGGTGLGLSTTRKLVRLLGGTLHLSSTVGQGTTVHVMLPLNAGA